MSLYLLYIIATLSQKVYHISFYMHAVASHAVHSTVSPAVPVLPEATPIPPLGKYRVQAIPACCAISCAGAPPTLLNLKTMKGADGKSLKIVETIAAHDYTTFGMCLLQDVNAEVVDLIEKDHISKGAERVTKEILKKWLTSDASTRTYQYLIECLRQSELGALAELITTVQGML